MTAKIIPLQPYIDRREHERIQNYSLQFMHEVGSWWTAYLIGLSGKPNPDIKR